MSLKDREVIVLRECKILPIGNWLCELPRIYLSTIQLVAIKYFLIHKYQV